MQGNVFLRKVEAKGELGFHGARIGGNLDCSGATLAAEGIALNAGRARVTGIVYLGEGFSCSGEVRFLGAQLGGDLDCSGARIRALNCEGMRLEGNLIWIATRNPENSYLDLLGASVKTLHDDNASWPARGGLVVQGLEYKDLTHHELSTEDHVKSNTAASPRPLRAGERVRWLGLQHEAARLEPQAWMWLAKLFREKGQDGDARWVLLNYRLRQAIAGKWYMWPIRVPLALLSWEPLLILLPFVLILFWGSRTYQQAWDQHEMRPTAADTLIQRPVGATDAHADEFAHAYPVFNPWIYTLENELPLVRFGMDEKWGPDPNLAARGEAKTYWWLAGFRWFLILGGWIQGILLTFGITRRFRD